jgi:N-acetyl sugar amidotransferase
MPDTRPGIKFDENGVCTACLNHDKKKDVDWNYRLLELEQLCDRHRKKSGHDCIIAVSGGKDSHFQVHVMKEKMRMNPLLVSVGDNFPQTDAGKHNFDNISEEFGCEIICLKPNIKDQKKVMRYTFEKYGSPTWHIDRLIYTYPLIMAQRFDLPLLVYGENVSYEYGGVDGWETPSAIDQIENGVASDVDLSGLKIDKTLLIPPANIYNLEPIYLSYFVPWNSYDNYRFAESRGFHSLMSEWNRSNHVEDFDQIDSRAYLVHPWMKYPKYGHSVATDYASKFVRYGMITRESAVQWVKLHDHNLDPLMVRDFCEFLGYSEKRFWEIVDGFYNPDLFDRTEDGWKLKGE